jgi:hypothetical protein
MKNWNIKNIFHSNHTSNSIALWEVLNKPPQKGILEHFSCKKNRWNNLLYTNEILICFISFLVRHTNSYNYKRQVR